MAHDRKWGNRFGDWIVKNVILNLEEMGEIVPKIIETDSGKKKSKSDFKLRDWSSVTDQLTITDCPKISYVKTPDQCKQYSFACNSRASRAAIHR